MIAVVDFAAQFRIHERARPPAGVPGLLVNDHLRAQRPRMHGRRNARNASAYHMHPGHLPITQIFSAARSFSPLPMSRLLTDGSQSSLSLRARIRVKLRS